MSLNHKECVHAIVCFLKSENKSVLEAFGILEFAKLKIMAKSAKGEKI